VRGRLEASECECACLVAEHHGCMVFTTPVWLASTCARVSIVLLMLALWAPTWRCRSREEMSVLGPELVRKRAELHSCQVR
jgi:hypothetical protein